MNANNSNQQYQQDQPVQQEQYPSQTSEDDYLLGFNNSLSQKGNLCPSNVAQWNDYYQVKSSIQLLPSGQLLHLLSALKGNPDMALAMEKTLIRQVQGLETKRPLLYLSVEGKDSEVFCSEDLQTLFEAQGELVHVEVVRNNLALVEFTFLLNAQIARNFLNGKQITSCEGILNVDWVDSVHSSTTFVQELADEVDLKSEDDEKLDQVEINKYVCKQEILVENIDQKKEFEIAKRIIGPKGKNMKEIVDKCTELEKTSTLESKYNQRPKGQGDRDKEAVKIRLRGRYSGQKEWNKQENSESLHLCISSKQGETQDQACMLVEQLLKTVSNEYKKQAEKHKCRDKVIKWKKFELTNNAREMRERENTPVSHHNLSLNKGVSVHRFKEQLLELDRRLDEGEILACIEIRNNARKNCDFGQADEYRELLRQSGVAVMDEKGGRGCGTDVTSWKQWKPFSSDNNQ